MINYKKTYKESTSWRHWRLSCLKLLQETKIFFSPLIVFGLNGGQARVCGKTWN